MNILFVLLQFGAKTTEPLSSTQILGFWGIILLLAALFVIFYIRTTRIVAANKQSLPDDNLAVKGAGENDVEEETAAAIALAMHMYKTELHDQESFTITLKKVSRIYSPWSSKIYTLRQNPR